MPPAPPSPPPDSDAAIAASRNGPGTAAIAPPLDERERARGRRLAIASHPLGMTHRMAYTDHLPTLVLVSLGASESVVGLQRAFEPLGSLLQLPTLRAVGRVRKRSILVAGHLVAVAGGLPLLALGALQAAGSPVAVPVVLASLALTAAGLVVSGTVWFPMLRAFVEPQAIGRFFGTLRSGWHLALILFFLGAQRWLSSHPGGFAPLFAVATLLGLLRVALIARLPERSERTGTSISVREALGLLATHRRLRRYLLGIGFTGALRRSVAPFAIVMMRRVIGFSDAEVVMTTIAYFTGGLVSLYLWGRGVDRMGPYPVFVATALGLALLYASLLIVSGPGSGALLIMVAFFFLLAVLSAGFGVADTHVLFGLAPAEAPARLLVVADVTTMLAYGVAPLTVGIVLELLLAGGAAPVAVYHGLFAAAGALQLLAFLPLRTFRREAPVAS